MWDVLLVLANSMADIMFVKGNSVVDTMAVIGIMWYTSCL